MENEKFYAYNSMHISDKTLSQNENVWLASVPPFLQQYESLYSALISRFTISLLFLNIMNQVDWIYALVGGWHSQWLSAQVLDLDLDPLRWHPISTTV